MCFRACEALMEHFSRAASHLVDTGGSIVPPAWRPGYPEGTWGRNGRNRSPGYRDIHTADSCHQSTELNPGWCGRQKQTKTCYICSSQRCVFMREAAGVLKNRRFTCQSFFLTLGSLDYSESLSDQLLRNRCIDACRCDQYALSVCRWD